MVRWSARVLARALLVPLVPLVAVVTLVAAGPALADGSYPPKPPPTSSSGGTHFDHPGKDRYCVDGFAPGSTVEVHQGGVHGPVVATIVTDRSGHGCTTIPVKEGCHLYTATGTAPDGTAAHSSVRICVQPQVAANSGERHPLGSTLPFTGAQLAGLIVLGVGLLAVGVAALIGGRRRRAPAA
jgi:hypothetical protein